MNLKLKKPQRVVDYFGISLVVPEDMRFLATDVMGCITAHNEEPWLEPGFYEGYEVGDVGFVELPNGFDFTKSLVEYKA